MIKIRIWGQRTERNGAAKRGGKRPRDTQEAQKDGNTEKKNRKKKMRWSTVPTHRINFN